LPDNWIPGGLFLDRTRQHNSFTWYRLLRGRHRLLRVRIGLLRVRPRLLRVRPRLLRVRPRLLRVRPWLLLRVRPWLLLRVGLLLVTLGVIRLRGVGHRHSRWLAGPLIRDDCGSRLRGGAISRVVRVVIPCRAAAHGKEDNDQRK
jgi:hypothetical protein